MNLLTFEGHSLWLNAAIYLVSAGLVWIAGTKITEYLDCIATRKNLGGGFVGLVFLGGVTSLPEMATVGTAAWTGNAPLAVNNMLGSVAINVLLLAFADILIRKRALTSTVAHASTLLQGTLDILLLSVVAVAVMAGDVAFLGVGVSTVVIVPLFVIAMWLSSTYKTEAPWMVRDHSRAAKQKKERLASAEDGSDLDDLSDRSLYTRAVIASVVILFAGYLLAKSGDAIARQTGLGSGLVGLVLVGIATSLPELSSVISAVRLKRYEMVVGDIFGTNLWNVALIAFGDLMYREGAVLGNAGRFEAVASLLGIILTSMYVIGFLERRDRIIFRLGYDSVAIVVVYFAGLGVLYFLQ